MNPFPEDNIVIANGDYYLPKARFPGRPVSIEVCGTFDGATVVPGYVSRDDTPAFVVDVGDDALTRPKTAAGRWISTLPASGQAGIQVSGGGVGLAIRVDIQDLLPR